MPEDEPQGPSPSPAAPNDPYAERLAELLESGLALGASLARGLAKATGSDDLPTTRGAPLDDLVTYGAATARNLARVAASTARVGVRVVPSTFAAGSSAGGAASSTAADSSRNPRLTAGSTLRVPLLVENTSHTPTTDLSFAATSLLRADCPDGAGCTCLPLSAVSFTPPSMVVGPKDFEKLTVRVATTPQTPGGSYAVVVVGGDGWFSTTIDLAVVAPG